MDTTTTSSTATAMMMMEDEPYISCIRVDGLPILPPLMTESKRAEMRFYRQLAIEREQQQQNENHCRFLKPLLQLTKNIQSSTPTKEKTEAQDVDKDKDDMVQTPESEENQDVHPLHGQSLRIRLNFVETSEPLQSHQEQGEEEDELDENIKPDENLNDDDDDDDDDDGTETGSNISDSPSSTGTFIICRGDGTGGLNGGDDEDLSPNQSVEIGGHDTVDIENMKDNQNLDQILSDDDDDVEEDDEIHRPEPKTVVRRLVFHAADLVSKRKRPTQYFDTDDEEEEENENTVDAKPNLNLSPSEDDNTLSVSFPTTSTSLSKYIASTCTTPGFNFTPIPNIPLPNLIEQLSINSNNNTTPPKRMTPRSRKSTNSASPSQMRPQPHPNNSTPPSAAVTTTTTASSASSSSVLMDISNLRNYYIANNEAPNTGVEREDRVSPASRSVIFSESSFPRSPLIPRSPGQGLGLGQEKMGNVGLSKFQNKMQHLNPALLKQQLDIRSPLLKGLVFPDPLERSYSVPKIPPQASDPLMKPKFDRITATAKGYLTRRLLHTEKIQILIQTIRDTVELLLKLYEENPPNELGLIEIKHEDQGLHTRLVKQLTGACASFNDIFFKITTKERMAIIAHDREKVRAKALRNVLDGGNSPSKRNMSSATLKSIERRQTESRSPGKKDNQNQSRPVRSRRSTLKPTHTNSASGYYGSSILNTGSQTVKPKGVTSYNVSPKRRRMSYIFGGGGRQVKAGRGSASARNADQNDNNAVISRPYTVASDRNSQQRGDFGGQGSETFLVPSSTNARQSQASIYKSSYSTTNYNASRPSMTRISATVPSSVTTTNRPSTATSRSSVNRVPWKK